MLQFLDQGQICYNTPLIHTHRLVYKISWALKYLYKYLYTQFLREIIYSFINNSFVYLFNFTTKWLTIS